MSSFADRLKQARKDSKLTQVTLAALLGVTRQTVNNYESGLREPGLKLLLKIAQVLHVSTDWLLGNDSVAGLISAEGARFKQASIFSQRMQDVRRKKKLTQQQLAEELGLPAATCQKLEKGQLLPDIVLIEHIAEYFHVSIDWFLGRDTFLPPNHLVPRKYLQEPYSSRLRERIILLRQAYQYTPEDVAYFLRLTVEEYQMFENGSCDPPVAIMLDLSRLYKLPVESLTIDNDYYLREMKKRFD